MLRFHGMQFVNHGTGSRGDSLYHLLCTPLHLVQNRGSATNTCLSTPVLMATYSCMFYLKEEEEEEEEEEKEKEGG